jgi:ABC-2 type transport system ATP-binding protein
VIRFEGVTRRFGALTALDRLDLEIRQGEIFGLVGPDGAGKTTAMRMICGLMAPTEGRITVAGLDVAHHLDEVKDQLGYMAQKFGLYADLTVEENLEFYGDLFGVDEAERERLAAQLLAMTRMAEFRQRPAGKLSGGMKQKLALMCTLLHRPKVLVLDEPTNGVDPVSRRDFWEILYSLAAEGMTILTTTAYLDEAERCNRVGLMRLGRMIELDTPGALRAALEPSFLSVLSETPRQARALLAALPGVIAAEPAGAHVHVYFEGPAPEPDEVRATLLASGCTAEVARRLPALEDVFIARIRREERRAA